MMIDKLFKEKIKKLLFKFTSLGAPTYSYNLDPLQLSEIINSLEKVKKINGNICEVGVARGMTTRFVCEYLKNINDKPKYYCIDTFDSFVEADVQHEINKRNKNKSELIGFSYIDYNNWKKNFKTFPEVEAIKTDVKDFNFEKIKPIKFAILDVDLYLPTLSALKNIKDNMSEGGILMVDDISKNNSWDGASQAFYEIVNKFSLKYRLVGEKCGIIEF